MTITILKRILFVFLLFVIVYGFNYLMQNKQDNFTKKLLADGVDRVGVVLAVKQYFPPKGKNGYGEISYAYKNIRGETMEARQLVSKDIFIKFKPKDKIDILYDPDKTHKSRIALTLPAQNL